VRRALCVPILLLMAGAAGCAAGARSREPAAETRRAVAASPTRTVRRAPAGLRATALADLREGTVGPFLGADAGGRLVVWLEPGEKGGLFARALDRAGATRGEARRLGAVQGEVGLIAVRSAPGENGDFLVLTTSRGEAGYALTVRRVAADGNAAGSAVTVAEGVSRPLWLDASPLGAGAVVTWAEAVDGAARLRGRALDALGTPRGAARELVSRALAWQAAPVGGGLVIGYVEAGKTSGRGTVALLEIGDDGAPRGRPVVVSDSPTAMPDLDLVALGDSVVLGWSDTRGEDPAVFLATVDGSHRLARPPERASGSVEPEAFVRLVPPLAGGPAYLVWEPLSARPERGRVVHLAPIDASGNVREARGEIAIASDTTLPEIVPTYAGRAALTLAPACPREAAPAPARTDRAVLGTCAAPALPFFVSFDRELGVTGAEPLRLDVPGAAPADAAWGLSCAAQGCLTLAALPGTPAPVYAVQLEARSTAWLPPAATLPPALPPRPLGARTLATPAPLADLAMAQVGQGLLAAWVTYFDPGTPWVVPKTPAPDGRFAPVQALLQVTRADLDPAHPTTVSIRARSLGGVALAPAEGHAEALVAWTAIDQGRPQVFATLVGERAQKLAQRMLTATPGEKSDVAAAWAGDGWAIGWIDERGGDAAPYVAKFDRTLRRVGEERRLTSGRSAASGMALVARDARIIAVWADAVDAASPGVADLFGVGLAPADLTPVAAPVRLAATPAHSFAPALAASETGVRLAWLEAGDAAAGTPGAVALAELDASGRVSGPVARVALGAGAPTGLALGVDGTRCQVAVSADVGAVAVVDAFTWEPGGRDEPRRLLALTGPAGQVVPLALAAGQVLLGEQLDRERGRVRALRVAW